MLADLVFALKMLGATLLLVLFMQIKVGEATIEDRAYTLIQTSKITRYLGQAAQGGVKLWEEAVKHFKAQSGEAENRSY